MSTGLDDSRLIQEADAFLAEARLLDAVQCLDQVSDCSLLTPKHEWTVRWAKMVQEGMEALLSPPDMDGSEWKKQGETHGHRDFTVYYRRAEENQTECRIDSLIEGSLLIPLLSVLNETDLFETWMPSFKHPFKMGVRSSVNLKDEGRGDQIARVIVDFPWPFKPRECTQHFVTVDLIEDHGAIAIHVLTETSNDNPDIPESAEDVVRVDQKMTTIIRGCPPDHPLVKKFKDHQYPEGEELLLISMKNRTDLHLKGIHVSIINFFGRIVFGRIWSDLLKVAEEVRDGKRLKHREAISKNPVFYEWLGQRAGVMMEKVKEDSRHNTIVNS